MSLHQPIRDLRNALRRVETEWAATDGPWRDSQRMKFERDIIVALRQTTIEIATEMDAVAELVHRELRRLNSG